MLPSNGIIRIVNVALKPSLPLAHCTCLSVPTPRRLPTFAGSTRLLHQTSFFALHTAMTLFGSESPVAGLGLMRSSNDVGFVFLVVAPCNPQHL